MSKVLVTGGTGFLGRHLVQLLLRRGDAVRVLTRAPTPELDALGVEVVEGSLTKAEDVARAVKGCERVYHAAGLVSRDEAAAPQLYRLHVDGTRFLLEAAEAARVKRVVVVSTSGTIAVTRGEELSSEASPYRYDTVKGWPYYLSKIYQEKLALEFGRTSKLDVVIVNPSILFGPEDVRLSSTHDVLRFLERKIPAIPSGGINFVDARDAAAGAILAMDKGRRGERYLLGGPNWSMAEFFERLSRASGVRGPTARIPDGAARLGAGLVEKLFSLRGAEGKPPLDAVSVEMSQHHWWFESNKARTELGWEPRDPMETLDDTVAELRQRFFGGEPPRQKAPSFLEQLVTRLGEEPGATAVEKPLARAKQALAKADAKKKPKKPSRSPARR